ncbi:MAG: ATP-binding protein [bacterium]
MKNPFFYGQAATGEYFTNRQEEIKALSSDLARSQNVIIFSPRRYGKTSLIKKTLGLLKQKDVLTFYVDLYALTSKKKFIEIFARAIAQELETDLNKLARLLQNLLPRILPKLIIKNKGLPELEFDFKGTAKNITASLSDIYEAIPKHIKKKKKKAVVVFDEFQEIMNLEDEEIERTLRSHIQFHHDVSYVFMGSKKHLMTKLFNDPNRPFYKSGRLFPLKKIRPEDFAKFISARLAKSRIKIERKLVLEILEVTECHPYYTQLFCSVLWERSLDKGKIEKIDLDKALTETISRSASIYVEIFDNLTNLQRKFLEALAKGPTNNLYSKDFILENELGAPSSIQRSLKSLVQKGILEKENGLYLFSDIFFRKWLASLRQNSYE